MKSEVEISDVLEFIKYKNIVDYKNLEFYWYKIIPLQYNKEKFELIIAFKELKFPMFIIFKIGDILQYNRRIKINKIKNGK